MRRPRAGDDNGDDRYGVRVDEPRRHLSSPLLLFSPSPSLLPSLSSSSSSPSSPSCFPSSSSSYLLLLPTAGAQARRAWGRRCAGRGAGGAGTRGAGGVISHVMMSWFVNTIRDDVLQTFSNFYHRICM